MAKKNAGRNTENEFTMSPFRQRVLSNEKILFLTSRNSNIIHDKCCPVAREIPDEDLDILEAYDPNKKQCCVCALKAYLRWGAKDPYHKKQYEEYFKRVKLDISNLRYIYVSQQMKTNICGDTLTLRCREDTWKIVILEHSTGKVQLLHNNYQFLPDGTREFLPEFHVQSKSTLCTDIRHAINVIAQYEPQFHWVENRIRKMEEEVGEDPTCRVSVVSPGPQPARPAGLWAALKKKWQEFWNRKKARSRFSLGLEDFWLVEKVGLPPDGAICIYVWESREKDVYWDTGVYSAKKGHFMAQYKDRMRVVSSCKVLAWKEMNQNTTLVCLHGEKTRQLTEGA